MHLLPLSLLGSVAEARANAPALDFGPEAFGIAQRAKEDAPGITMRFLETGKVGE